MRLTEHFTLAELTESDTALRLGIDNTPPTEIVTRLRTTAEGLERIRKLLGQPVIVTSGYRCLALNRAIGSRDTSQHVRGEAADFRCPNYGAPAQVARFLKSVAVDLDVDQLILEYPPNGWCHVSFSERPRHALMTIDHDGTHAGIA